MSKKYICYGGYMRSKNDGEDHYIDAHRLPQLYKVKEGDCIFINSDFDAERKLKGLNLDKFKKLYPRHDGDYTLD
jgi:hypothetical protein